MNPIQILSLIVIGIAVLYLIGAVLYQFFKVKDKIEAINDYDGKDENNK